jgi:hypothetical protein
MIIEMRTYTLQPGTVASFEERFGQALPARAKISPLAAFWHTEIGPLNEIIHVWGYKDLAERARIRAEAAKEANWPPKIREFIVDQNVEVLNPFPFIPDVTPGTPGPIFEIRRYTLAAGSLPGVMKRWEAALPARVKLSPLVTAGGMEFGGANRFIHIWAYQSMDQRLQVREQGRKAGVWPPPGGGDELLAQETKIVMPSAFSPLQ